MVEMRLVVVAIIAALGYVVTMLGIDVWVHDQTLAEACHGSPGQIWDCLTSVAALAIEYKVVTLIALGITSAILLIREVPALRSR